MAASPCAASRGAAASPALLDRPAFVVLLGFLLSLVLSWPRAVTIWQDNTFFDTDDAMRLVQVRAWLAGQGWFDLVAHRLDPPGGLLMHWSRVVDLPLAGLIRLFALFAPAEASERLARIAFPLAMQLALMAAGVALGTLLAGRRARVPSMILVLLSGFVYEQFPPGRIDHHAPQIVLLVGMTAALLSALEPRRAWHAALAALAMALSLAISLENLPFIAVLAAVLPLAWVADGRGRRSALLWLAGGLALGAPAVFAATVPPSRYGVAACDAFSIAHLAGLGAGLAGMALLAALNGRLTTPIARAGAVALVGAAVGCVMLLGFPACLRSPYAAMDPVLQRLWLAHVTEAQPLFAAARLRPDSLTVLGAPLAMGAAGLLLAACFERGLARLRWLVMLALVLAGIAGTLWEVRVSSSVQPLAAMGGVWAVTALLALARRGKALAGVAAVLAVLPFSTLAWAFVPAGEGDKAAEAALRQGRACRAGEALAPLAALPTGLVFAPIDDGAHLLVATPHTVVAAPYHRNEAGNRRVLDGFLAPPETAAGIVRAAGARYVALCPGEVEITALAEEAPQGLGARLAAGAAPAWLRPVPVGASPYKVFAVQPPEEVR